MAKKESWFKAKKVTAAFAAVALVTGFLFLDRGITGNVVLNNQHPIDIVPLAGLLLVFCSATLAVYSTRK